MEWSQQSSRTQKFTPHVRQARKRAAGSTDALICPHNRPPQRPLHLTAQTLNPFHTPLFCSGSSVPDC